MMTLGDRVLQIIEDRRRERDNDEKIERMSRRVAAHPVQAAPPPLLLPAGGVTIHDWFHANQVDGRAVIQWTRFGDNEPMIWVCRFYNDRKGEWGFALCHYTHAAIRYFEAGDDVKRLGARMSEQGAA